MFFCRWKTGTLCSQPLIWREENQTTAVSRPTIWGHVFSCLTDTQTCTHTYTHTYSDSATRSKPSHTQNNKYSGKIFNNLKVHSCAQSSCWKTSFSSAFRQNWHYVSPILTQLRCKAQSSNQNTNQSHSCNRSSTFQIQGAAGNRKERNKKALFL